MAIVNTQMEDQMTEDNRIRCAWAGSGLMREYHDQEWGRPVHDDRLLFEFLILEGAQAGLSWSTILNKRAAYRAAFDGFEPQMVAGYGEEKLAALLQNAGIVRNRGKISSAVGNARAFLAVQAEFGSFDRYIWGFTAGKSIVNQFASLGSIPAQTEISRAMSKDLGKRGFRFIGPTICYAFMQATGMVNDHTLDCFCYRELAQE